MARDALRHLRGKLAFLLRVGLGYLTLGRQTRTLSGGEAQRINLANQLGSQLVGTLYILDEPSIGLHARDTARLAELCGELAHAGNTVVIVEHDRVFIGGADHVVEMGPGSGERGGDGGVRGLPGGVPARSALAHRALHDRPRDDPPAPGPARGPPGARRSPAPGPTT